MTDIEKPITTQAQGAKDEHSVRPEGVRPVKELSLKEYSISKPSETPLGWDDISDDVLSLKQPVVLRGLADSWPIVQCGQESPERAIENIRAHYTDKTVNAFFGEPEISGRFFYNDALDGFNFDTRRVRLDDVLDAIQNHLNDPRPPAFYVGSTTIDSCLPGFREKNDMCFGETKPLASIWMGNQSRIAAHYDAPQNLACNVVGRRRFTLFPPDQIDNLYVGPLDFTPAGQPASMVDFTRPDAKKHPRFREALNHALVAELGPGDGIFIPSMWWHHVEGLAAFNVLVNYWWRDASAHMGPGVNVLNHALLSLRDLPAEERDAWKHIFEYYIFGDTGQPLEHLPEDSRGVLSPLDTDSARQLRAKIIAGLNR